MSKNAGRRLVLLGSFLFAQLLLLFLLRLPAVPGEGSWLKAFRGFFSYDQLSYAAIASTVAAGNNALVEPFTETGTSFYPSLWYRVLGWLAAVTGLTIPTLWTVAGWFVLAAAVFFAGVVAYRISGLAWAPLLTGAALSVGILATVARDSWMIPLESHAVLWPPAGLLYVLNAEVIGVACVVTALLLILWARVMPPSRVRATVLLSIAGALIGITANIQTYSFFVGLSVALSWLAAYAIIGSRSRGLVVATVVLLVGVLALGALIGQRIGGLAAYSLFVLITLPGVWSIARRAWRTLLIPAILLAAAAAPQALLVASGTLRHDPFLAYRQDASASLSVNVWVAILATLPVAAVWLFNLSVQRRHRSNPVLAVLIALAFAGTMLTFNQLWGFGQEPYRLWLNCLAVSALILAPVTAWSISQLRAPKADREPTYVPVTAALAIVLFGLSVFDIGGYRTYVSESGVIRFDTARAAAIAAITEGTQGLLASDPCIDPAELKILSRKPVAFYNLGIAWPDNRGAIDAVQASRVSATFSVDALHAAGVDYVVQDSACATPWNVEGTMGAVKKQSLDYSDETGSGTISLWQLFE